MRNPLPFWIFWLTSLAFLGLVTIGNPGQIEVRSEPVRPPTAANGMAEFSILFGIGDEEPDRWDGSIRARGAQVVGLDGWRLTGEDRLEATRWTLSTRRVNLTRAGNRRAADAATLENGVYVTVEILDADARFEVQTAQGNFSFAARDAPWGETLSFLDGRVKVEQVPLSRQLTDSIEQQDFPALAASGEKVYLAYVEFRHGDRSQAWPWPLQEKPDSYEPLRRSAGGDQVLFMEYSRLDRTWSAPEPVSEKGQDAFGAAVAVGGAGRIWVIWSAQVEGNFDLYARCRKAGRWLETIRLTSHPGPDLYPVAVTDSEGAVWIAWQGYRGSLDVLVSRQQGEGFSPEQRVSFSGASDWSPQLAAGPGGEVAVVWDTYDKGDYDVYLRKLRYSGGIRIQEPVPIAATHRFEARPSVIYDPGNRIWVAYEESNPAWGKDFGAYETTGSGLYQGNTVRVKILQGNRYFRTADSLAGVLKRLSAAHPVNKQPFRGRIRIPFTEQPDPKLVQNRPSGSTSYPRFYPSTSHPRLAATTEGTVFLAYRNAGGRIWGALGTTWFENIAYFDGSGWQGPIFVPSSDGILDNRPALLGLEGSGLLMVATTDHRFSKSGLAKGGAQSDSFNYDLMTYELSVESERREPSLTAIAAEQPAVGMKDVAAEKAQVAMMRQYRVTLDTPPGGPETLRLLRGEFHRHTAISGDGANDGDIMDAWRYLIDAAYMDWAGCCDHDNGGGREYTWWLTQKMTDAFLLDGRFIPMFSYERSVRYPEGHRNVVFAQRGIRPLPRLPRTADDSPPQPAPDTQMLYEYLRSFDGVAAVHTSGTNMGTDWRDNDPEVEPMVEIYQGDRQNYEMPGAPRTNTDSDSIGGWRSLGFVSNALAKGYRLGFQASSDHVSTHMSYCNLWVTEPTREAILEGLKKRRVYGATDNILADVRCSGHFMGEEFTIEEAPTIKVKLVGTAPFAGVYIVKDGRYAYFTKPAKREVEFSWSDISAEKGKTSYYYIRGEQVDGEIVWVSPMWITVE
ncbi:hypothetical protein MYX65_06450 [Acidobacteria bacterium AH-259-L09]|nr:hypothetical protein [Acidobacteria bacterium AH-259-L09]